MAFGQDFLKAFFGNDYLRDYAHASKTFRTNGYENSPRLKFLYYVSFTINTSQIPNLGQVFGAGDDKTIGLLVKTIDLPKYTLDVETMNQYNRKRLIQKKINYDPINVKFHDDGGDLIRKLWYNYYAYYYKDPSQKYGTLPNTNGTSGNNLNTPQGFSYNDRDQYAASRVVNDWGFVGEAYADGTNSAGGKPPFFRDIKIYGFNQHKFVFYTLINPLITSWQHDTYDYSQGDGIMENTVTIAYETVKYGEGGLGAEKPDGFADPAHYDTTKSPLSRPGGTTSIIGQGGLLDVGQGIIGDLQSNSIAGVIGAVQKAGTAYGTFKGKNLQAIAREEAIGGLTGTLRNTIPGAVRAQQPGSPAGTTGTSIQERLRAPVFNVPPKN